jgi:hypothetical protein
LVTVKPEAWSCSDPAMQPWHTVCAGCRLCMGCRTARFLLRLIRANTEFVIRECAASSTLLLLLMC